MACSRRVLPTMIEDTGTHLEDTFSGMKKSSKRRVFEDQCEWEIDPSLSAAQFQASTRTAKDTLSSVTVDMVYAYQAELDELVIHKRKVAEVENWFQGFHERVQLGTKNLLLVSGPTGSGKTACFSALCKRYRISVLDGFEFVPSAKSSTSIGTRHRTALTGKPLLLLPLEHDEKNLLTNPCVADVVELEPQGQLLLFDDLPNPLMGEAISHFFLDDDSALGSTRGLQIALLVTDPCCHQPLTSDLIMRRVLGRPNVTHIVFNPLAVSLQKRLAQKWSFTKFMKPQNRSIGDARGFLIDCLFESLTADRSAAWNFSRDSSIGMFHALGKILYGKLEGVTHQDVADLTESDRILFQHFLHENYPDYICTIDECALVADTFSFLDAVDWRVRSDHEWHVNHDALSERLIFHLTSLHPRCGFKSVRAPKFIKVERHKVTFY